MTTRICGLLAGICVLGGCKAAPQNFDQAIELVGKVQEVAKEQGWSWSADLAANGDPAVYQAIRFGVDTGVTVKVHVQANAQTAASGQD